MVKQHEQYIFDRKMINKCVFNLILTKYSNQSNLFGQEVNGEHR